MNEMTPLSPRFAAILERARNHPPLPVAVVDAHEAHVLAGVVEASDHGLIEPVLLGPRAQVEAVCRQLGCPSDRFPIINVAPASEAAETGVQLVLEGKAAALIKGWIHTDELMRPVLRQLRTARRVSHIFVADLPSYHKLLFITDAAINIAPDLATKAEILQNAIDLARILGVDRPKAAALSAIELVRQSIPSTLDAACRGGRCRHFTGTKFGCRQHFGQESRIPRRGDIGRHRDRCQCAADAHLPLRSTRRPSDVRRHCRIVAPALGCRRCIARCCTHDRR